MFQNATAQTQNCLVYDDLTIGERTTLGISEQNFQAYLNSKKIPKSGITTFNIPQNYTITPKKFRIKFWSVQYENKPNIDQLNANKLPEHEAIRHVKILNHYYKDQSICFELGGIGVLKTDSLNTRYFVNLANLKTEAILKNSYDVNSINIYL